ncbi:MAG: hypothetical protein ACKPFA_32375, partial [Dolichospermum sp.]
KCHGIPLYLKVFGRRRGLKLAPVFPIKIHKSDRPQSRITRIKDSDLSPNEGILKTGRSFTVKIARSIDIQRFLRWQKSNNYPFLVYINRCNHNPVTTKDNSSELLAAAQRLRF